MGPAVVGGLEPRPRPPLDPSLGMREIEGLRCSCIETLTQLSFSLPASSKVLGFSLSLMWHLILA